MLFLHCPRGGLMPPPHPTPTPLGSHYIHLGVHAKMVKRDHRVYLSYELCFPRSYIYLRQYHLYLKIISCTNYYKFLSTTRISSSICPSLLKSNRNAVTLQRITIIFISILNQSFETEDYRFTLITL